MSDMERMARVVLKQTTGLDVHWKDFPKVATDRIWSTFQGDEWEALADGNETEQEIRQLVRGELRNLHPDAFTVHENELVLFEIENTSLLSVEKLQRYVNAFWLLDALEWSLGLVVTCRYGVNTTRLPLLTITAGLLSLGPTEQAGGVGASKQNEMGNVAQSEPG